MAQNERFAALQREAFTALVASLDVPENRLHDVTTKAIRQVMRENTFLTLDPEKTSERFQGIVEKFEANSLIAQVNRLESSLDDFLERRLGEKRETESELHWGVLDFVIHLANSPTNAHEIENPIQQEEVSDEDDEEELPERRIVDRSQWASDDETLSTWSDVTDDEPIEVSADEDESTGQTAATFKPIFKLPNRSTPLTTEERNAIIEGWVDKLWGKHEEPPWVEFDVRRGLSICNPIPNNKTHATWVDYQWRMTETEGGWELTHERQVLYWIAKFGEGYPSGNALLFDWSKERDEYITNPTLNFTMCVPGGIQALLEPFRLMATRLRKLHVLLESCRSRPIENQTLGCFYHQVRDILENRVFVFFRRIGRLTQVVHENPLSLRLLLAKTEQVRREVDFLHAFVSDALSSLATMQSEPAIAAFILGKAVTALEKVELIVPHLVPEFNSLLLGTLKPWLLMMEIATTADPNKIEFADFPLKLKSGFVADDFVWAQAIEQMVSQMPDGIRFIEPLLPMLADAMKSCEILRVMTGRIVDKYNKVPWFDSFSATFASIYRSPLMTTFRPVDSCDSQAVHFRIVPAFKETELAQFRLTKSFARGLTKVESIPMPKLSNVDDLIRTHTAWRVPKHHESSLAAVMQPIVEKVKLNTRSCLSHIRKEQCFDGKTFEDYITAVTSFYLGQTGDVLGDIAQIIFDDETDRAGVTIKVEEALESCSALRRFASDFHICFNDEAVRSDQVLMMTFDIPPPAKYIITESAMETYGLLYRANLRLRLAKITLDSIFWSHSEDQDSLLLRKHLELIITALISFTQSGVILPLLTQFQTKMAEASTFDEIYSAHSSMLELISRRALLRNQQLGKNINWIINLAIDFKKARQNPASFSDFVQKCTECKIMLEAISERGTAMSEWTNYLADMFYYTPNRNNSTGHILSAKMQRGSSSVFNFD